MKLLLVEDQREIAEFIQRGLQEAHHHVTVAHDGETGLQMALERPFALIILDVMLPKRDGWSVCRELRDRRIPTPILMLTARAAVSERVQGLQLGADDYLVKPFDFAELLARVQALLRRNSVHRGRFITITDLQIDTAACQVTRAGRRIEMTQREYSLLEALATQEGRVLSRETILDHVWQDDTSYSNTVDVHIKDLRKKVDQGHEVKLIHSVYGQGYVLEPRSEKPASRESP